MLINPDEISSEFLTFKEFAQRYTWPTKVGLQGWKQRYGKEWTDVFVYVGSRVMVNPKSFFTKMFQLGQQRKEKRAK